MKRRKALDIKRKILELLKEGEKSLRELETKVNTNYKTIRTQVKELEYFGLIEIVYYNKNRINGRPYTTIKLKEKLIK
jgi:predicted ArsR family transcriptional regulator